MATLITIIVGMAERIEASLIDLLDPEALARRHFNAAALPEATKALIAAAKRENARLRRLRKPMRIAESHKRLDAICMEIHRKGVWVTRAHLMDGLAFTDGYKSINCDAMTRDVAFYKALQDALGWMRQIARHSGCDYHFVSGIFHANSIMRQFRHDHGYYTEREIAELEKRMPPGALALNGSYEELIAPLKTIARKAYRAYIEQIKNHSKRGTPQKEFAADVEALLGKFVTTGRRGLRAAS